MEKINNSQNIAKGILMCSVIFFHSKIFLDYSVINKFNILFLIFPCLIGIVGTKKLTSKKRRGSKH